MSAPDKVLVQFTAKKPRIIPDGLPIWRRESLGASKSRRARNELHATNNQILEKSRRCSVASLLDDLADAGYYLVNVYRQTRRDQRNPLEPYYTGHYLFAQGDAAAKRLEELREEYLDEDGDIEEDLLDLIHERFWDARAYLNVREDGASMVSINLDGNEWLCEVIGDQKVERKTWQIVYGTDGSETKEKLPVKPDGELRFTSDYEVKVLPST